MMHSVIHREANSSSDESTTDLFSPVEGRKHSLHFDDTPDTPAADGADSLPRLADNSWIGARVSPIASVDDDDDDDDRADEMALDQVTAPYHKAMRDFGVHERSALLGRRIHPMWNHEHDEDVLTTTRQKRKRDRPSTPIWGKVVVGTSALHLFAIGLHDVYIYYLQARRGVDSQYSIAWSWPWIAPSARILLRFGAYCPDKIRWQGQWYRVATSLTLTASIMEWIVLALAWWRLEKITMSVMSTRKWQVLWPIFFLVSTGTGQLWMSAFASHYALSGCAGWGTCGVLCGTGVSRPDYRFSLFLTAIALVLLNLLQSTSNVFGAIGASFFGWSLSGVGVPTYFNASFKKESLLRPWSWLNWLAFVTAFKLWAIPILYILLFKNHDEPPIFDSS